MKPLPPPKPVGRADAAAATGPEAAKQEVVLARQEEQTADVSDAQTPVAVPSADAVPTVAICPPARATVTSDVLEGFAVRSEFVAYSRYLQVQDRQISYPDGRVARFDVVGHSRNEYAFTVIFVYHTATQGVTLLREFAQAAPPHGARVLTLPCGGYDPGKHGSVLMAAKAELSEEARLCGGTWHCLLPEGHPGVLESKWCRNRFTPFLCVNPSADAAPAARDAEEQIEILSAWPLPKVIEAMETGELLLPSLQTCVSALAWLRRADMLPEGL